jgi:multiple sugar transport system substrate-binding protein
VPDKHFDTFLKVFTHPKSSTVPITPIGADHLQTFSNFIAKWYSGKVNDLRAGLRDVDKQIDAKIKQSGEGGTGPPGSGPP